MIIHHHRGYYFSQAKSFYFYFDSCLNNLDVTLLFIVSVFHIYQLPAKKTEQWIQDLSSSFPRQFQVMKVKVIVAQLCLTLWDPWTVSWQAPLSMEFSRQEYWSGLPFLQGISLTQGPNLGLLHCRHILYHLSHQGSPYFALYGNICHVNYCTYIHIL